MNVQGAKMEAATWKVSNWKSASLHSGVIETSRFSTSGTQRAAEPFRLAMPVARKKLRLAVYATTSTMTLPEINSSAAPRLPASLAEINALVSVKLSVASGDSLMKLWVCSRRATPPIGSVPPSLA